MLDASTASHPQRRASDRDPERDEAIGLDGDLIEGAAEIARAMGGSWTSRRVYRLIEAVKAGQSDAPLAYIAGSGWTSSRILISRWLRRKLDPANKLA